MQWAENVYNGLTDKDEVFAYETTKWVRVLDRRLGFVYYFILTAIVVYVVLYVCIIEKQYLDFEKSSGWVSIEALNNQKSDIGMAWDKYDTVTNPGEQGAIFIPTKVVITKDQSQDGFCESLLHNCTHNDDCDIDNEQLQKTQCSNGHCLRRQWCPPEDPSSPTTETQYLDYHRIELWFSTYVHYHKFQLDVSTTDEDKEILYPLKKANTYPLHDLIRMANIDIEEVIENGAVLIANAMLDCDLDTSQCGSKIESTNVDTKNGFNYVHYHTYFDEQKKRKRDAYRFYGIRVLAFATGFGTKTSFPMIVLQLSSGIALMMVAQSVADFVLMFVVPEKRHYTSQKVLETEDFNED